MPTICPSGADSLGECLLHLANHDCDVCAAYVRQCGEQDAIGAIDRDWTRAALAPLADWRSLALRIAMGAAAIGGLWICGVCVWAIGRVVGWW